MSLYLGNNLIAPNQSNAANKSLSNLDATGQGVINGKVNLDGSNATFPHVVESYVNGNSGYILYSPDENGNKRCIQWGVQQGTGTMGAYTVYLLKDIQLPYVVERNLDATNFDGWFTGAFTTVARDITDVVGSVDNKNNSSFRIQGAGTHSWRIDGYLYEV